MSLKYFVGWIGFLLNAAVLCLVRVEANPDAKIEERAFRFNVIGMHEPLEHTFHFKNSGQEVLQLGKVNVTAPLQYVKATPRVSPGENGSVTIRLGEPRKKGDYQ